MSEFSIDICCPECSTCIDVKLTELHMGGRIICPKCGVKVEFSDGDLYKVRGEANRIEDVVRKF